KGTKTSTSSRMVPLPAQRGLLGCAKTPLMLFEHSKLLHSSGRCAPGKDGTSARFRSSSLGLTGAQTSDLVEGHTRCHGGVEGLPVADRDVHVLVAVLPHESGQALALGTRDEREWAGGQLEAGQGGVPGGVEPHREQAFLLEELEGAVE